MASSSLKSIVFQAGSWRLSRARVRAGCSRLAATPAATAAAASSTRSAPAPDCADGVPASRLRSAQPAQSPPRCNVGAVHDEAAGPTLAPPVPGRAVAGHWRESRQGQGDPRPTRSIIRANHGWASNCRGSRWWRCIPARYPDVPGTLIARKRKGARRPCAPVRGTLDWPCRSLTAIRSIP